MPLKGGRKADDDDDDDYEDDYVEDDEDEDDFIPGVDDDDDDADDDGGDYDDEDDSDNDNDTNQSIQLLDGILTFDDTSKQLQYTGDTFHLQTSEPLPYNVLDATTIPPSSMITFFLEGHCNVTPSEGTSTDAGKTENNLTKFQITLSLQDNNTDDQPTTTATKNFKKGDDDDDDNDDDEEKKGSSKHTLPSKLYQVYGQEILSNDTTKLNVIEFTGSYHLGTEKHESSSYSVPLICVIRFVPVTKSPTKHATPVAAAARGTNLDGDDDDDDDDNGDPDEDVDYDELIALHEDAGLPVETVRKRYRGGATTDGDGTNDGSSVPKKPKASPTKPPVPDYDDDVDDDDIGF